MRDRCLIDEGASTIPDSNFLVVIQLEHNIPDPPLNRFACVFDVFARCGRMWFGLDVGWQHARRKKNHRHMDEHVMFWTLFNASFVHLL